ncbi:hypothetical protein BDY17DRAFT_29998 [Neohortaea acidophila]|uniref:GPI anchored protein n=1 Tax=Neohortaea acidophila TaxID=245834 RepID=A0A6A6PK10_9PEZI|nr:uncharacterized protein BDY17DRAFT_29998 [Neohortaea acidophila]KAF2480004.1 hypothetical protein BDY17DRAFT_29998 [Neohortaea acidophila]
MREAAALLALPASLLLAILASCCTSAAEVAWPYNLPRTAKYYPEHEAFASKEWAAQEKLAWRRPTAVRKMSGDEGEKFFLQYWAFEEEGGSRRYEGNASMALPLLAPIAPHGDEHHFGPSTLKRGLLAREFKCPTGTHSCSSIGSDLCCNTGESCISTKNGYGCCPDGETCGDDIGACKDGYTSCPNSSNGGCCIPGASCDGTGCIVYGTSTVTTTLPTVTVTSGSSGKTTSSSSSETTDQQRTVTETIIISGSGYTTTKTVTVETGSICKSGFHSCPASLGGGCCRSGQSCGSNGCPNSATTTTISPSQPIRPTSVSASTSSTSTTTTTYSNCPSQYYQCSAHFIGGCCQIGRNCDTTSCPPATPSTITMTSGATIIQSAPTSVRGQCMGGWSSCPAAESGGCCPSGYNCGTASCSESRNGLIVATGKSYGSGGTDVRLVWSMMVGSMAAVVGLLWL